MFFGVPSFLCFILRSFPLFVEWVESLVETTVPQRVCLSGKVDEHYVLLRRKRRGKLASFCVCVSECNQWLRSGWTLLLIGQDYPITRTDSCGWKGTANGKKSSSDVSNSQQCTGCLEPGRDFRKICVRLNLVQLSNHSQSIRKKLIQGRGKGDGGKIGTTIRVFMWNDWSVVPPPAAAPTSWLRQYINPYIHSQRVEREKLGELCKFWASEIFPNEWWMNIGGRRWDRWGSPRKQTCLLNSNLCSLILN